MPSVIELRAQLKALGLPTGGKKSDLEDRISLNRPSRTPSGTAAAAAASGPSAAAAAAALGPSAADLAEDVALLSRAQVNKLLTLAASKDAGLQEKVLAAAAKRGGSRCRAQASTHVPADWSGFSNTGVFGQLDKDIIVAIVSQLPLVDRLVLVRMVCRDFRAALMSDADLWQHLDLAGESSLAERVRPARFAAVFKGLAPLVRGLRIANLKVPVAVIKAMLPCFPRLEQLDLFEKGSSSVFTALGVHCPLIKRLGLRSAKISHTMVLELCEKLPLLEQLGLEDTEVGSLCSYHTNPPSNSSFYRRLAHAAPNLVRLSSHFTIDALETLGATMNVQHLVLRQLPLTQDQFAVQSQIPRKVAPMPHLTSLVVADDNWSPAGSFGIRRSRGMDTWLALLLAAAPNLRELSIPGFDSVCFDRHSFLPDGLVRGHQRHVEQFEV
jgi:hypothetical protein